MSANTSLNANTRDINALLFAAQTKLFAENVPALLRISAFLRLSCLAMPEPGQYSKLMKALFEQDGEWYESCSITEAELILSSNPKIHQMLIPILQLHQPPQDDVVVHPSCSLRQSA